MRNHARTIAALGIAALLAGCAATPVAESPAPIEPVYAVETPARLWVGDTLGVRVLASLDPVLAMVIARGPDARNTFTMRAGDEMLFYATVPELE